MNNYCKKVLMLTLLSTFFLGCASEEAKKICEDFVNRPINTCSITALLTRVCPCLWRTGCWYKVVKRWDFDIDYSSCNAVMAQAPDITFGEEVFIKTLKNGKPTQERYSGGQEAFLLETHDLGKKEAFFVGVDKKYTAWAYISTENITAGYHNYYEYEIGRTTFARDDICTEDTFTFLKKEFKKTNAEVDAPRSIAVIARKTDRYLQKVRKQILDKQD